MTSRHDEASPLATPLVILVFALFAPFRLRHSSVSAVGFLPAFTPSLSDHPGLVKVPLPASPYTLAKAISDSTFFPGGVLSAYVPAALTDRLTPTVSDGATYGCVRSYAGVT